MGNLVKLVVGSIAAAVALSACGSSGPSIQTFTAAQVEGFIPNEFATNADWAGITVGSVTCPTPLTHINDQSNCQVRLNGGGYSGTYVVTVTLKDGQGNLQFDIGNQVTP